MITEERYWYDGWNIIGRADFATDLVQNFVWGLDLSGTMQGAGGVGGLLLLNDSTGASYFYDYDGNGNVLGLINANDGTTAAQYDYDPFLGVIRADGLMGKANPFLAATKCYDWDNGLYYYGYRYYDPSTGRWLSRDPMREYGGCNIYSMLDNNAVNQNDILGLFGPLAKFVLGCVKEIAEATVIDWLKNAGDKLAICDQVRQDVLYYGKQITLEGYDFDAPTSLNNAQKISFVGHIGNCLFQKIKEKEIGNLLKELPDDVRKKLLEKSISGAIDSLKDMTITTSARKVHAKCTTEGINVAEFIEFTATLGDQTFTLSVDEKDFGTCMGTEKGLLPYDMGCECMKNQKQ